MDISLQAINSLATEAVNHESTQHISLPTTQQWEATNQDVAAFEQALNTSNPKLNPDSVGQITKNSESSFANDVLNKMQSLSTSAAEKGEQLENLIMKATDTLNPMDIVQANRMMSEYYLESMMTAKLVGNATKAVEKLTSLN